MSFDLTLEKVSKRYLRDGASIVLALDDVSLEVPAAQVVAITGPSGSGKSTLLHVVGGMDRLDSGTIRVGTQEVTSLSRKQLAAYRRTIGFVFQRFHLLPVLTALENVAAPVMPLRTDFDKFSRAGELLAALGLAGKERSIPSELSGGEQQRVAIARALINDPGLVLADEPTGNLDSETSVQIMQLLLDLRQQRGMTIVIATHDPMIATRCDRIVSLSDGRVTDEIIVASFEAEEVLKRIAGPGPGS
jgi:putative ABC transport system ATP-binding protein